MRERNNGSLALIALCSLALADCGTSVQNSAPAVQSLTVTARRGAMVGTLTRGREIFTMRCAECHVLQPISKYSVEQWQKIVDVMAPRANLSASNRVALRDYLTAARESINKP
jgi:cytochrome c5